MIFIENKYTRIYYNIVESAKSNTLTEYTEVHHIIPRSLGGSDEPDNLVTLTAKQHYMCHRLLVKMTEGEAKAKMHYALSMMVHVRNSGQQERYMPPSVVYEQIRHEWRESMKGRPTHNKGKTLEEMVGVKRAREIKEKLSRLNTGKTYTRSEEYRKKQTKVQTGISKGKGRVSNRKGIAMSEEQKEKQRQNMLGKNTGPRSEETKRKISEALKARAEKRRLENPKPPKIPKPRPCMKGENNPMYGQTA